MEVFDVVVIEGLLPLASPPVVIGGGGASCLYPIAVGDEDWNVCYVSCRIFSSGGVEDRYYGHVGGVEDFPNHTSMNIRWASAATQQNWQKEQRQQEPAQLDYSFLYKGAY